MTVQTSSKLYSERLRKLAAENAKARRVKGGQRRHTQLVGPDWNPCTKIEYFVQDMECKGKKTKKKKTARKSAPRKEAEEVLEGIGEKVKQSYPQPFYRQEWANGNVHCENETESSVSSGDELEDLSSIPDTLSVSDLSLSELEINPYGFKFSFSLGNELDYHVEEKKETKICEQQNIKGKNKLAMPEQSSSTSQTINEGMKTCSGCKEKNKASLVFCDNCGKAFLGEEAPLN